MARNPAATPARSLAVFKAAAQLSIGAPTCVNTDQQAAYGYALWRAPTLLNRRELGKLHGADRPHR